MEDLLLVHTELLLHQLLLLRPGRLPLLALLL